MREAVFTAFFDPVTADEIRELRRKMKDLHIRRAYLTVREEGILPAERRRELLQMAVKPYRHILVKEKTPAGLPVYDMTSDTEISVRRGEFRLAARGIRKALLMNGDYFEEILDHACKPSRAAHCRAAAALCAELAEAHGVDPVKAYRAGLLHDLTKNLDPGEQERIMRSRYPEMMVYHPNVWHSFTAVHKLHQDLGIRDADFLHAVYTHTLGDGRSKLCRILYIADKTEPTRAWDSTAEVTLAKKDLKAGRDLVFREVQEIMEREKHV